MGLGDALEFPKADIASAMRVLRASDASAVRRMRGGAATDHHGHLARVQSGVARFYVLCCMMHCVRLHKFYPAPLKLRVFVGGITALLIGKKQGSGSNGRDGDEKVLKNIEKRKLRKKGPQIVDHGEWKGRKE